jgi:hypothetical protein
MIEQMFCSVNQGDGTTGAGSSAIFVAGGEPKIVLPGTKQFPPIRRLHADETPHRRAGRRHASNRADGCDRIGPHSDSSPRSVGSPGGGPSLNIYRPAPGGSGRMGGNRSEGPVSTRRGSGERVWRPGTAVVLGRDGGLFVSGDHEIEPCP